MSEYFNSILERRNPKNSPKKFDMVSKDESIVGDAKYLTLVHGEDNPPAKFAEIGFYVWLLENVDCLKRFLVFGNQIEVPILWLKKYRKLVKNVDFYFIDLLMGL